MGPGMWESGCRPSSVEQRQEQHQPDEGIIFSRIRKNGAAREGCAADDRQGAAVQTRFCRRRLINPSQAMKPAASHQSARSRTLTGIELMLQPGILSGSLAVVL